MFEFKFGAHWGRYTEDRDCQVLWSVGLRTESDLTSVLERVTAAGTPTQDISGIEEAQVFIPVIL